MGYDARRRTLATSALVAVLSRALPAAGQDAPRRPMPEPILSESVTDIDGLQAGEVEISGAGGSLRSRTGGAVLAPGTLEVEWLATSRLGLRVEPGVVHTEDTTGPRDDWGVGATVSWKLVRDVADDFYVQGEIGAETAEQRASFATPETSALPFAFDALAGWRTDGWTLRATAGAAAGGTSPYAPLRASLALLRAFDRRRSAGFFGLEGIVDGTWTSPFFVAPDLVADLAPVGAPARLGLAIPWAPGAGGLQPSLGVYLRLIVEPRRDPRD